MVGLFGKMLVVRLGLLLVVVVVLDVFGVLFVLLVIWVCGDGWLEFVSFARVE